MPNPSPDPALPPVADLRRHLVPTRHGHVHVRTTPPTGDAPPLVLLHMSPLSGRMFDRILPLLAPERQLVVPDRLGFGCSDRLRAPLPFEEYALATLDALHAIGVERFDVCGIHTGSAETIELARSQPERVRRAAVVSLPVFTPEEVAEFKATYSPPPDVAQDGSHLTWAWQWWRQWQEQTPGWTVELLHEDVLEHVASWPHFWWTYHAVFDYPMAERVAAVGQPLLVFAPDDDLVVQTERAREHLPPTATMLELPHMTLEVFTINAEELAGHLRDFLA